MRAVGLMVLVGACAPSGLTIEVVIDDPAMVKVELYAAAGCEPVCAHVTAPPGLSTMSVDDAFVVDDPRPFIVEEKDFSDGVAGFRIESAQDATLAILVAVGYDANNEIKWSWSQHEVEIPDADAERWRVHLDPTSAISPLLVPQPAGTERAAQWPHPRGGPACLLLEHWGGDQVPVRELLGPSDDRDCDGVAEANECAPWIPHAIGASPTIDQANCVTLTADPSASVCRLGGPQCTEDPQLPHETCTPVDPTYCTPSMFCQCAGLTEQFMCMRDLIVAGTVDATQMPYVYCAIGVAPDGNRCDTSPLEIDLGAVLSSSSRKCAALRFNNADAMLKFGEALQVGAGKLYIDTFTTPCKASVKWSAGTAPLNNYGLMDAEIDNGYHLVLPVRVDIKPGCLDASFCRYVNNATTPDSMFTCVGAEPPLMNACAPDPQCAAGPLCNGVCCPAGEACGPDGCSCAGGPSCTGGDHCENGGPPNELACGQVCCGVTTLCPL